SPRPGTVAERTGAPVPPPVARERAAELRAIGAGKAAAYASGRAGTVADVVVVGVHTATGSETPLRKALTEDYLEVALEGEFPRGSRLHVTLGHDSTATPL
ncbi:MAG: hypothetical protein K8S21_09335, partial [Gemmatimonadetes bacterium]|nr:hypothetical protein [Gemmatimonadota bacterium]